MRTINKGFYISILVFFLYGSANSILAQELFKAQPQNDTRWFSFENLQGEKGKGGMENQGAKGHPDNDLPSGASITLLETEGSGVVNRIWLTIRDRSPEMLRSLKIEMFWDGSEIPAVSVPLGDFFGVGLGRKVPFESYLFSDPEGRSFNCLVPMPFKDGAKITITNESDIDLAQIFYDINIVKTKTWEKDNLYFHAYWNRELVTELGKDFKLLPKVQGEGRYLGNNIGVIANPDYLDTWWGEGEVKIFLDGDEEFPTLVGSGTEDYIGSAWKQETFNNQFQGCLVSDNSTGEYAFYRYHIRDAIIFHKEIEVTIQQIGGGMPEKIKELISNGASLIPITVTDIKPNGYRKFDKLLEFENVPKVGDKDFPEGWINYYRQDDVSATSYFYLDKPYSNLPALQSVEIRTANIVKQSSK